MVTFAVSVVAISGIIELDRHRLHCGGLEGIRTGAHNHHGVAGERRPGERRAVAWSDLDRERIAGGDVAYLA